MADPIGHKPYDNFIAECSLPAGAQVPAVEIPDTQRPLTDFFNRLATDI